MRGITGSGKTVAHGTNTGKNIEHVEIYSLTTKKYDQLKLFTLDATSVDQKSVVAKYVDRRKINHYADSLSGYI